jgi:deoxyribodipyrimidine photo-lyase
MTSLLWFRRDLRLGDNPALNAACDAGQVVPLFVIDPQFFDTAGAAMRAYQVDSLAALTQACGGALVIRYGDPRDVVPQVVKEIAATDVHCAADYEPAGAARDMDVEARLYEQGVPLVRTGSPYAVAPGRVAKADGTPYRVYSPFYKAWLVHGWRGPVNPPADIPWAEELIARIGSEPLPARPDLEGMVLLPAGEAAALQRWKHFAETALMDYADNRDRPDFDSTSQMSGYLRFGEIHVRTMLADLGEFKGHEVYRKELAWREFYADVLWNNPATEHDYLDQRFVGMRYNTGPAAQEHFTAWTQGRTGYPIVDAGMRQLQREGWIHNRVRMIVASFLVKDLHLEWTQGAEWFMRYLRDADVASNQHGWQWTAGCGTDAAPYFRVFNPTTQGLRFDPEGAYIREYIPELRHLRGAAAHEPWDELDGYEHGYPMRIVDHATERDESLARYQEIKVAP